MEFKVTRFGFTVSAETEADVAFIEDTLGLKKRGDTLEIVRITDSSNNYAMLTTVSGTQKNQFVGFPQGVMPTSPLNPHPSPLNPTPPRPLRPRDKNLPRPVEASVEEETK